MGNSPAKPMKKFQYYWNCVWDDPVVLRRMNGWLTVQWGIQVIAVSFSKSMQTSVRYLIVVTIVTAFLSQLANWQAARVEVRQAESDARLEALLEALTAANHLGEVDVPPEPEGS